MTLLFIVTLLIIISINNYNEFLKGELTYFEILTWWLTAICVVGLSYSYIGG